MLLIVFPMHLTCFVACSRSFICCYIPHSRCSFFAISISLRFCRYLFLITGVSSHCCTFSLKLLLCFSFPGMRSSFIRLFPHGRCYSLYFYCFYIQEIVAWHNSFSFSLCFCVSASSFIVLFFFFIITGFFYRFTITLLYSKLCFSFSGMRSSLFVVASWPMFFIALLLWFIT